MSYVELQCSSHFSFLRGASSCEELFAQAAFYGMSTLAITDRNSLAGIVQVHQAAKATGIRSIIGCRVDMHDGASVLVYPTNRAAYSRLCRLLSVGKARGGKTLGIPLFQEQAMQVAIVCAGFSPGEADQLRRSMGTFKFSGGVSPFREKLISGMIKRGYEPVFAVRIFNQLQGFGSYGFPESHAASFAILSYTSCWLKRHHPDIFCAALLNAQPMGFYAPAQIVRDAREHGIEVRQVCVNKSHWDCTLEPSDSSNMFFAVRLGMRMVKGLHNAAAAQIIGNRGSEPYACVEDIWQRGGASVSALNRLAEADAFLSSFKLARREALWAVKGLMPEVLPLFAAVDKREQILTPELAETSVPLRAMTEGSETVMDYSHTGLSLRKHPVSFLRDSLRAEGMIPCGQANKMQNNYLVKVAGLVLVRQKPGSAKGVMFITIEDEDGACNVVVWPKLYEQQRRIIFTAGMIAVNGKIQREGEVVHLVAYKLFDLSAELASVGNLAGTFPAAVTRGDEIRHGGGPDQRTKPQIPKVRDIYIPDLHIDSIKVKTRDFR